MNLLIVLALFSQNIEFISSAVLSGADRKLAISENRLYSACERGLDIFDINQPESIRLLGHYDTPGIAYGVAIKDTLAFVADNFNGLLVLNVVDPTHPELLATYPINSIEEVEIKDTFAFCGSTDLEILNISNPANPFHVGGLTNAGVKRIALKDTLCLIATQMGLAVVNISYPSQPRLDTNLNTSWLRDVKIQEHYAYVCGDTELLIFDLNTLTRIGKYDANYLAFALAIKDSFTFLCRGQQMDIQIVNVADPAHPVYRGSFSAQNGPQSVAASGHYVFTGVWSRDLLVTDFTNPASPVICGRFHRPGELNGTWRDGNLVVTADRWFGMSVVDVTDINHPVERGEVALSGWPRRICLVESLAYVANYDGLAIVSVADPDHPVQLGQVNTSYYTYELAIKDTLAFVAEREWNPYNGNLLIINVADPYTPHVIGTYPVSGGGCEALWYNEGNHCYIVCQGWSLNEFAIINVSNPQAPYRVSGCNTNGYPVGIGVSNQYAYVITTSPTNNLLVISIADTLAPVIVNTIALSYGPRAIYVRDPYLFISYYYYGIEAFDISNPSSPVSLDRYNTTGNSFGMYVDQSKYIYLADGHSLVMLHMTPSGISETKKPMPNPSIFCRNVLSLAPEYKGEFRIIDAMGRQIKKAVLTSTKAIDISELSAGIYYICLEQNKPKRLIKVK